MAQPNFPQLIHGLQLVTEGTRTVSEQLILMPNMPNMPSEEIIRLLQDMRADLRNIQVE